jgi:hypothetical protein
VCPPKLAKNETAASWAVVIDIGWNGKSGDVVDIEHLTRRPTARPNRARRQHSEAIDMATLTPLDPLRQAAEWDRSSGPA